MVQRERGEPQVWVAEHCRGQAGPPFFVVCVIEYLWLLSLITPLWSRGGSGLFMAAVLCLKVSMSDHTSLKYSVLRIISVNKHSSF